jgi:dihydroorotate dehydrogenase (NAD+) catalytic subunit
MSCVELGDIRIDPPFTIPSGIVTINPSLIAEAARRFDIGLITTKSVGLNPYDGYPEPIVSRWPDGSLSTAVGLSTMGCDEWVREMKGVYPLVGRFLLTSVFGKNADEFLTVTERVLPVSDGIELNFCCPHSLEYGESVARQEELTIDITREVRKRCDRPLVVKLSPNIPNLGTWAGRLVDAGADAVAAIGPTSAVTVNDPTTGDPVLSFGKGGLSGRAILSRGLECVAQIRAHVDVPIIAGGGIESAADVRAYRAVGGNVFAVGTALAGMDTPTIEEYFRNLHHDLKMDTDTAVTLVCYRLLGLEHRPAVVRDVAQRGVNAELRFEESIESEPGQFLFAWIPGVGEKPFSIAASSPLTLGVRRAGKVSRAIAELRPGDRLLIRGPLGKPFPPVPGGTVLVAGGCGAVPIRFLAERCETPLVVLGARTREELLFADDFRSLGQTVVCTDDGSEGVSGTVLDGLRTLSEAHDLAGRTFVTCGPEAMMGAALDTEHAWSPVERLIACVERYTACGIGLCGKCSMDGYRTCVDGPWFSAGQLAETEDFNRYHRVPSGKREPLALAGCEARCTNDGA